MSKVTERKAYVIQLVLLGVMLILAHLWLIAPVIQNGDAAVYNEQIERRMLGVRTTHVGYMLLGIAFDRVLPFGVERNLNLMSLIFASFGGVALAAISRKQRASMWVAGAAPLLAFGLRPYLYGAVLAEVDVVGCSLVLVALAIWVHGRCLLAGFVFGAAMLVTPVSALSLPLFLFGWSDESVNRRWLIHLRRLVVFAVAGLVAYLPLVIVFWQDYWLGGRGILHAPRQPWAISDQVARSVDFFKGAAGPWLVLAVIGVILAVRKRSSLAWGTLIAIGITAVAGERFLDVPVQLPHLCILTVFATSAIAAIPRRSIAGVLFGIAWIGTAFVTYRDVVHEVDSRMWLRSAYLEMAKQTPKLIVAGLKSSWDDGLPFERLVYNKTKLGLGLDMAQFGRSAPAISRLQRDYAIWLMAPVQPHVTAAFAAAWRRETRTVQGRAYEVWVPIGP